MKEVIMYSASDGSTFSDKGKCERYEKIVDDVNAIMSLLHDNEIISSETAIRHKAFVVQECFRQFLLTVCKPLFDSDVYKTWFDKTATGEMNINTVGRLLSDYSDEYPILNKTYYRFLCINMKSGIEYEQPYFVSHENEFHGYIAEIKSEPLTAEDHTDKDDKYKELRKITAEMETYEKKIFVFDHEENDFTPTNNGKITPKEDGFYITFRCGLSGIYTVINEWKDGHWLMNCADGSTTIAFSRKKVKLKSLE